ncbi:hypothetical protein [Marinicellulosiphila megalodicopiae]|uniref:hypothetical protein n=1 Tax=Marinicellulosiphila megalodicopiae TaxID=2724896 RepID=UPI003BAF521B
MFLLSNIKDRDYKKLYPTERGVIFDITDKQLKNAKNIAWNDLKEGSIICVVTSTRNVSTFFRVTEVKGAGDATEEAGESFILKGDIVGKLASETSMGALLSRFKVEHKFLPKNKFSIGFNVADLGDALDKLKIRTREESLTVAELKAGE